MVLCTSSSKVAGYCKSQGTHALIKCIPSAKMLKYKCFQTTLDAVSDTRDAVFYFRSATIYGLLGKYSHHTGRRSAFHSIQGLFEV